ncbi:hypothetical protein V8C42DRAFT_328205 [Trichoderma barbatum]
MTTFAAAAAVAVAVMLRRGCCCRDSVSGDCLEAMRPQSCCVVWWFACVRLKANKNVRLKFVTSSGLSSIDQ